MFQILPKFNVSKLNRIMLVSIVLLLVGLTAALCSHFVQHRHSILSPAFNGSTHNPPTSDPSRYAAIRENFPDPCIVRDGEGNYYAFASGNYTPEPTDRPSAHVQVASAPSTNLSDWTLHRNQDAMPVLADWVTHTGRPTVWGPSVAQRSDGRWILYYSAAHHIYTERHCVGAAVSSQVLGPYQPINTPIACPLNKGGAIDPAYFFDPIHNISHLIYKQDGNSIGSGGACSNGKFPNTPTPLVALKLNPETLIDVIGSPTTILTNTPLDGPNIEAPAMWYSAPTRSYHLIYSSGCYHDMSYNIKHIVCLAPANPFNGPGGTTNCSWQRAESLKPLPRNSSSIDPGRVTVFLKSHDRLIPDVPDSMVYAPGGASVLPDGSLIAFHGDVETSFIPDSKGSRVRGMFIMGLKYQRTKDYLTPGKLVYHA